MPRKVSTVVFAEPEYAPGRLILLRTELPDTDRPFVWCGRSLGWLPFKTTSNAFFHLFSSKKEAQKAADKYVTLPVTQPDADRGGKST